MDKMVGGEMKNGYRLFYSCSVRELCEKVVYLAFFDQIVVSLDVNSGEITIIKKESSIGECRTIGVYGRRIYLFEESCRRKAVEMEVDIDNSINHKRIIEGPYVRGKKLGEFSLQSEKSICFFSANNQEVDFFDYESRQWVLYEDIRSLGRGKESSPKYCFSASGFTIGEDFYLLSGIEHKIIRINREERKYDIIEIESDSTINRYLWLSYESQSKHVILFGENEAGDFCILVGSNENGLHTKVVTIATIPTCYDPDKIFIPVIYKKYVYLIPVYEDICIKVNLESGNCDFIDEINLCSPGEKKDVKTNYSEGIIIGNRYYTVHLYEGILNCINLITGDIEKKELFIHNEERNRLQEEVLAVKKILYESGYLSLEDYFSFIYGR